MALRKNFVFQVLNGGKVPIPPIGAYYYVSFGDDPTLFTVDHKGTLRSTMGNQQNSTGNTKWTDYNSNTITPINNKSVFIPSGSTFNVKGYINFEDTSYNTLIGYESGVNITTASKNTLIGYQAGLNITTSRSNTLIGRNAGKRITTDGPNIFIGKDSGEYLTLGKHNTGIGNQALKYSTGITKCTAIGNNTGQKIENSTGATLIGCESMGGNYIRNISYTTAIGSFIGASDLFTTITASTLIGYMVGSTTATSDRLMIDNHDTNFPLVDGDFLNRNIKIGGSGNTIASGVTNSAIIGGANQTLTANTTVMMPKIELTENGEGVILVSPSGNRFKLVVSDTGSLSAITC